MEMYLAWIDEISSLPPGEGKTREIGLFLKQISEELDIEECSLMEHKLNVAIKQSRTLWL